MASTQYSLRISHQLPTKEPGCSCIVMHHPCVVMNTQKLSTLDFGVGWVSHQNGSGPIFDAKRQGRSQPLDPSSNGSKKDQQTRCVIGSFGFMWSSCVTILPILETFPDPACRCQPNQAQRGGEIRAAERCSVRHFSWVLWVLDLLGSEGR